MHILEYFMWGYQPHFRIGVKVAAERIFQQLDPKLIPKVFLVGILVEERADRHPVCLEPEDCGYAPNSFHEVLEQAKSIEAIDEERHIFHSHPGVQENHDRRRKIKAIKTAVEQVINRHDYYNELASFCSWPVLVEGFQVLVVLQFERNLFESHYSLLKDKFDRMHIETSLLNATVNEFLGMCSKALTQSNPGASFSFSDRNDDEVIRVAGRRFMYTPACAGANLDGLHGLFEACNAISSMRYEGAEGLGRMIIARKNHPNVEQTLVLASPVRLQEYRAVRKLLEMSSGEISLLCDSAYIIGFGRVVGLHDQRAEDLFTIIFTKHYTWELVYSEHILMRVTYGQPQLPRSLVDREKFFVDTKRIFKNITDKQLTKLWGNLVEATTQKHGTMIVVSTGASKEAQRLAKQSTIIEPLQLAPHQVKMLTAIDGAILVDLDSTCYALGVILDGLASKKGTPSRGARYNSAIRYVETTEYPCIAIVVSEDGTVDIVPDLMPQIRLSLITKTIETLRQLAEEDEYEHKKYSQAMNWLDSHRFYLVPSICEEVNALKQTIEDKHSCLNQDNYIRIVYPDFIPNDEMNESYFLNDEVD